MWKLPLDLWARKQTEAAEKGEAYSTLVRFICSLKTEQTNHSAMWQWIMSDFSTNSKAQLFWTPPMAHHHRGNLIRNLYKWCKYLHGDGSVTMVTCMRVSTWRSHLEVKKSLKKKRPIHCFKQCLIKTWVKFNSHHSNFLYLFHHHQHYNAENPSVHYSLQQHRHTGVKAPSFSIICQQLLRRVLLRLRKTPHHLVLYYITLGRI